MASNWHVLLQQLHDFAQLQDAHCGFSSGLHRGDGCDVLRQFKGCLLLVSSSPGFSTVPSDYLEWEGLSVRFVVFWPLHVTVGLHQSICYGLGVGLQES